MGKGHEEELVAPNLAVLEAKPLPSIGLLFFCPHRFPEGPSVLESIASFTISDQTILRRNING